MEFIKDTFNNTNRTNFNDRKNLFPNQSILQDIQDTAKFLNPNNEINSEQIQSRNLLKNENELFKIQEQKAKLEEIRKNKLKSLKKSTDFKKDFISAQKSLTIEQCVDDSEIRNITKENPWDISIINTISSFRAQNIDDPEKKFRIGGRLLYSTSKILSAKSISVLQESKNTQNEFEEDELDLDEEYDPEEFGGIEEDFDMISQDSVSFDNINNPSIIGGIEIPEEIRNDLHNFDEICLEEQDNYSEKFEKITGMDFEEIISPHSFYNTSKKGEKYLASPIRKSFKKIDFGDLGKALVKTFNSKLRTIEEDLKSDFIESDEEIAAKILPDNILRKAEEKRAQVEEQINAMNEKILAKFDGTNPISFLNLILSQERRGIVQTLLYLLHLVNRQKIELWQKLHDFDYSTDLETLTTQERPQDDVNIYVTPLVAK